jgi:hypothetical protein
VNLDLALDLAAPISAAVAANANAALPIDAAVTANVLSPDAISLANADQNSLLQQILSGSAIATSNQDSAISQGETSSGGGLLGGATATPAASTGDPLSGTSLLDIAADLNLDLDLAAPIDAAIAANANIAAPIDAAVSANILSPGAVSLAGAHQDAVTLQSLEGLASATTDQSATIDQGEHIGTAAPTP